MNKELIKILNGLENLNKTNGTYLHEWTDIKRKLSILFNSSKDFNSSEKEFFASASDTIQNKLEEFDKTGAIFL